MPFPIAAMAALQGATAVAGASAAKSAAKAQARGADNASRVQRQNVNAIQQQTAPGRILGGQAMNALGSIYGYAQSPIEGLTPQSTYGGTPLNESDWRALNGSWGTIREAANYGDISAQHRPQGLSAEGQKFIGDNWGSVRSAANFGDIDWTHPSVVGTPGYQPQGGAQPTNALAGGAPNYDAFYKSPDYDFTRRESFRDIGNQFAAQGGAQSGNALKALQDRSADLAAGNFQNYFNNQMGLAGIGQEAINTNANVMTNAANVQSNAAQNAGDARASGVVGAANALGDGVGELAGMAGYYNWLGKGRNPRKSGVSYGRSPQASSGVMYG